MKTALYRFVNPDISPMSAVENISANPFMEGPTKSKSAAKRPE